MEIALNDDKFIVKYVKGKYSGDDTIKKVIKYIFDDKEIRKKRKQMNIVGAIGTSTNDIEDIISDFKRIKKIYNKTDKKQVVHIILSFNNNPQIDSYNKYRKLIVKTASFWGNTTQVAYALHEDTKKRHIHFALNTIKYNGKRLDTYNKWDEFIDYCHKVWDEYL